MWIIPLFLLFFTPWQETQAILPHEFPYVTVDLEGQLGNQMFQIAACISHAKNNGATALIPDLINKTTFDIPYNYSRVFFRIPGENLPYPPTYHYREIDYPYKKPPYTPGIHLHGGFFSEKYFKKHEALIRSLYAPSEEILETLLSRFSDILTHPQLVGVHVRTYEKEDPQHHIHTFVGWNYFYRAMNLFPEDALFIVCSDQIEMCKEAMKDFGKNILFIEGQDHVEDFYLLTLCHHNILSNSTFSWWSAYLNNHSDKKIVAPHIWFPKQPWSERTLLPKEWIKLPYDLPK